MLKSTLVLALFFTMAYLPVHAQVKIAEPNATTESSAILDIQSNTQGVLLPRLTNEERDAINSPVEGLIIYNSDENKLQVFNGTYWKIFVTVPPSKINSAKIKAQPGKVEDPESNQQLPPSGTEDE